MGKSNGVFAVRVGRKTGLFDTWDECKAQTNGYTGASFKKFPTVMEAQAWLDEFNQSARNVFPVKDPSTTRSTAGARASAAPYSIPNMASKLSGKQKAPALDADRELADAQSDAIVVYTDGASKNNQDARTRVAGYGIHWARGRPANVESDIAARCPGIGQTNNIGELWAIIRTLELTIDDPRPLRIYSDSKYSIDCLNKYAKNWADYGWMKKDGSEIANVEMIRYMDALKRLRHLQGWEVEVEHVKGHASSVGNNTADNLANQGCLLPANKAEPMWSDLRQDIEERIDQICERMCSQGKVPQPQIAVRENTTSATLVKEPAKASAVSISEDDFSDFQFLSNSQLLAEVDAE